MRHFVLPQPLWERRGPVLRLMIKVGSSACNLIQTSALAHLILNSPSPASRCQQSRPALLLPRSAPRTPTGHLTSQMARLASARHAALTTLDARSAGRAGRPMRRGSASRCAHAHAVRMPLQRCARSLASCARSDCRACVRHLCLAGFSTHHRAPGPCRHPAPLCASRGPLQCADTWCLACDPADPSFCLECGDWSGESEYNVGYYALDNGTCATW